MLPGKSHLASGLAAAAIVLCLLSSALPAWLAGDPWQAAISLLLLLGAAPAGLAAWNLHRSGRPSPEPQPKVEQPGLRLIDNAASALRDGLVTIRGFSELLAQGEAMEGGSQGARTASRFIRENSEELTQFVTNLQDFVRYEQGRLSLVEQQVDAAELVEAALSLCRGAAESADVVLVAELVEGLELRCDPQRVRSAISNMVLWATEAVPPGSVIAIRLRDHAGASAAISVTRMAGPPWGGDAGAPFEPRTGLRGLALPVARRVALLHSGDLTVGSEPGAGTTARFVLPPHRVFRPEPSATA